MSYRKSHVKGKIHKIKPKIPLFKKLWFWVLILAATSASLACYFIVFYPGVQVDEIIISGNQEIPSENIKSIIKSTISHNFGSISGWLLSSKSIFLADTQNVSDEILKQFPEVQTASVSRKFFQTIDVKISKKQAVAIFCQNEDCYLIDRNGTAFEKAQGQDFVIVRQNISESQAQIGKKVLDDNIADLIARAQKNLNEKFQIRLETAVVASNLRLNAITSEGWKIYFDISYNFDQNSQILKLSSLLEGEISQAQRKNLRYIDLRPKDRAVICDNAVCGG